MDISSIDTTRHSQLFIYFTEDELRLAIKEHFVDYSKKPVLTSIEQAAHVSFKRLQVCKNKSFLRKDINIFSGVSISPCAIAVGVVVADVLGFAFSLLGIGEDVIEASTKCLLGEMSEDKLLGLKADLINIYNATEIYDQAVQVVNLFFAISSAVGGISAIVGAIENAMTWYDWIFMAATIVAQLTLWFGTDGAALVAELCLEGSALAGIALDTASAVDTCSN